MEITVYLTCVQLLCKRSINDLMILAVAFLPGQGVKGRSVPAEWTRSPVSAIKFECPDMTPALDVKEHYSQLAERLQVRCSVT